MIDYEASWPLHGLNKKERLRTAALAAAGICAAAATGYFGLFYTGWLHFPGANNVFYISHGSLVRDSWIPKEGETPLRTDADARRVIGLYDTEDGTYLFDDSGEIMTGWHSMEDGNRYFEEDGRMAVGWREIGGDEYYFAKNGTRRTGWVLDDGKWYRMRNDGRRMEGWLEVYGIKYYLDNETGEMRTGWVEDDGNWYLFAESGAMLTGEQEADGKYYYLNEDGVRYSGWKSTDDGTRYYSENGHALIGWNEVDDNLMYFDESGYTQSGKIELDGELYYLGEDGTVSPGWHEIETENDEKESFFVCRDGFILDTGKESGNSGRLIIRDCGIDVALNKAKSRDDYQKITDAEDSALVVKERRDIETVIADRRSQGFEIAEAKEDKSFAYIVDSKGKITEYVCSNTSLGRNTGEDVIDDQNLSVWKQNEGGFCTYTSAGTDDPSAVRIAFWKLV